MQPLKIAILSTSRIVEEFLQHLAEMPEISVQALCCRPQSGDKARAWAQRYGVPAVYTDEDACYAAGGFDAVYIGTANHLHYAAAKRALQAGYSVILEKPFTGTAAEARELFALADEKGVMLLEAITVYYLPQYAFLQQELAKIGPVRGAMASFCARSRRYDDFLNGIWNTTFDPACQGGALNDMNVYNLHLLCGLLGAPQKAEYRASRAANGIDTAGLALLDYGEFTAAALGAKDSEGVNGAVLQGPGGRLVVEGGANALPTVYSVLGGVRGGGTRTDAPQGARFRMAYEFAEFARILQQRDKAAEAAARARTLTVMDLLDALHGASEPGCNGTIGDLNTQKVANKTELQYTWDKKSYRRMIEAVARTKGSRLHKAARAVCVSTVLVGGLPFWIAFLLVLFEIPITPVWLLAYAILLVPLLAVFIVLGSFLGVKLQYIRMVSILGRDGMRQIVGTPCTLRLQDDILYKEGPTVGPFASSMTRPAASLRTVRTGSFGLVLVFRDGTSSGVPMSAFNQEQPLSDWKQALEQAMAAPPPVMWATVADGEDTPVGFSCKQGGDPTLIQRCSPARAEAIYRESMRSLMGIRAYWRWYRVAGLLLLLLCAAFLVWMVLKSLFNVLWVVISFGILYRSWRHTVRNVSERMVGKSVDVFAPDAMVRTNLASGTQGRLAYTEELWLVETPCAISLYQPRYSTLWSFDREVFATPQEEAAFLELLKQRFTAIHSCE